MASSVCRLNQDLNLNDYSHVVEKDDALKRGFNASTEFGDVSKCDEPCITEEASLKQPSVVVDDCNIKRKGVGARTGDGDCTIKRRKVGALTGEVTAAEEEEYSDDEFFLENLRRRGLK